MILGSVYIEKPIAEEISSTFFALLVYMPDEIS